MHLLGKQQGYGCTFVVTSGAYDLYRIEGVYQGWRYALEQFRNLSPTFENEKRIEVWRKDVYLGDWVECITKAQWSVLGAKEIEKGVRWEENE